MQGRKGSQPGRREQPLILVVEDNDEIRDLLTLVLEEAGYGVVTVAEGGEVVERAREARPDLITLDLALPGKDGWEILRELNSQPDTREIPVVVISAYTREIENSLRQRASRVIPKPFYINQIVSEVEEVLGGQRS